MKFLKAGLVALVLAVGAGALLLERQSNTQLREEVALLRGEVRELAKQRETARAEANRAASNLAPGAQESDRAEIARLREEMDALKAKAQEFGKVTQGLKAAIAAASAGKSPVDSLPVKLIPVTDWKNAGKATPAATVETVLWGAVGGDVDLVAGSVEFTPSARAKAQALLDALPPETRAQYGSPEKLVALMIAKDTGNVSGMQVLGSREMGDPDTVGMRLRFGNDLGQTKESSVLLHQASDGWRVLLTDDPVEKWAKQLSGGGGK
jgi:hypothetical protein